MGINQFASRRTYAPISVADAAGAVTAAGGAPVQVCGFIVMNASAETIWTVYDGSNNAIFTFQHLLAKTSFEYTIPWMADKGIKIGNNLGTGAATIFHNSPGN
jgi:hypothetical protein